MQHVLLWGQGNTACDTFKGFNFKFPFNYAVIPENVVSERIVADSEAVEVNRFHVINVLANL